MRQGGKRIELCLIAWREIRAARSRGFRGVEPGCRVLSGPVARERQPERRRRVVSIKPQSGRKVGIGRLQIPTLEIFLASKISLARAEGRGTVCAIGTFGGIASAEEETIRERREHRPIRRRVRGYRSRSLEQWSLTVRNVEEHRLHACAVAIPP